MGNPSIVRLHLNTAPPLKRKEYKIRGERYLSQKHIEATMKLIKWRIYDCETR